jgi:hypothetical protein
MMVLVQPGLGMARDERAMSNGLMLRNDSSNQGMVELVQKFEKFESASPNFWALDFDVPSRLESNLCPVEGFRGFHRLKIDRDPLDKQRSIELWRFGRRTTWGWTA